MTTTVSNTNAPGKLRLSVERSAKIFDDDMGYWVSIGPSADGDGLAEIIYSDGDGKADNFRRIVLPWDHMICLAQAIVETHSLQTGDPA